MFLESLSLDGCFVAINTLTILHLVMLSCWFKCNKFWPRKGAALCRITSKYNYPKFCLIEKYINEHTRCMSSNIDIATKLINFYMICTLFLYTHLINQLFFVNSILLRLLFLLFVYLRADRYVFNISEGL